MTSDIAGTDAQLAQQINALLGQGLPDGETLQLIRRLVEPARPEVPGTAWERHDDPEQSGGDRA
ncbi:hypothetical protein [Kribbella sp. NPDC023855]|uniref:hypothetical protein n=1 Tax=Kribbella sp. NPDC023855 TaxID=3154698 RepID=UPI0033E4FF6E